LFSHTFQYAIIPLSIMPILEKKKYRESYDYFVEFYKVAVSLFLLQTRVYFSPQRDKDQIKNLCLFVVENYCLLGIRAGTSPASSACKIAKSNPPLKFCFASSTERARSVFIPPRENTSSRRVNSSSLDSITSTVVEMLLSGPPVSA